MEKVPLEFADLVKIDDEGVPDTENAADPLAFLETAKINGGVERLVAKGEIAGADLAKAARPGQIHFTEEVIDGVRFRIGRDAAGEERYTYVVE